MELSKLLRRFVFQLKQMKKEEKAARPARVVNVGLYDYVTKKKLEVVSLSVKEDQKISQAAAEYLKKGYGGRTYVETHDNPKKPGHVVKMIFTTDADWFMMFGCKK